MPMLLIERVTRAINNQGNTLRASLNHTFKQMKKNLGGVSDKEEALPAVVAELEGKCQAAMAMCVLLAVKLHMQAAFGMSEQKYQEWVNCKRVSSSSSSAAKLFKKVEDPFFSLAEVPAWDPQQQQLVDRGSDKNSKKASAVAKPAKASRKSSRGSAKAAAAAAEEEESSPFPPFLQTQYEFFSNLMEGDEVLAVKRRAKPKRQLSAKAKAANEARKAKTARKKEKAKNRKRKKRDETSEEDEESEEEDVSAAQVERRTSGRARKPTKKSLREESEEDDSEEDESEEEDGEEEGDEEDDDEEE